MKEKIKVIIADDNVVFYNTIKVYLETYEEIEILGTAYTDEEEIKMIQKLKPDIVITDLMRNHKYTGLEIIKHYISQGNSPQFLVISTDNRSNIWNEQLKLGGYITKPIMDYSVIIKELLRIRLEIIKNNQIIIDKIKQL